MELRDIEYFAVVAEHRNLRRAAEALGLSQPALSKSLRRLEASVGAKLVRRVPKGVELTTVGDALVAHVGRIRVTLDDVAREAADLSHGRAGHLRIGASPAIGEDLPGAYALLIREAPKLSVQIITNDNDVTVPMLRDGKLDLIFNYIDFIPAARHEDLAQEHLYDDEFVVCASDRHRLAKLKRVTLADLAQERWVLSSPQLLNVRRLQHVFQENGLPRPQIAVEARSLRIRLQIWAGTDLLGYVSKRVLRRSARQLHLTELAVAELEWRRSVGVIYRKDAYLSPAGRRFIEILRATANATAPTPQLAPP
jgi:DNA-binding transcriptional LysR family regulator